MRVFWLLLTFVVACLSNVVLAAELPDCRDARGKLISVEFDSDLDVVAKAEPSVGAARIRVNLDRYPFSFLTVQWLFYRECAHLSLDHDIRRLSLAQQRRADCWAIREMAKREKFMEKIVLTIERDLKRLRDPQWFRLLGAKRHVDLFYCLAAK